MSREKKSKIPGKQNETAIVRACQQVLALRGIWAERQNTGAAMGAGGGFIRFGTPGRADISGLCRDGVRLEVEVKVPGGKQSPVQKVFQEIIERNNGIYLLVHSAQELLDELVKRGL